MRARAKNGVMGAIPEMPERFVLYRTYSLYAQLETTCSFMDCMRCSCTAVRTSLQLPSPSSRALARASVKGSMSGEDTDAGDDADDMLFRLPVPREATCRARSDETNC